MDSFSPTQDLSLIARKQKGLIKLFGGLMTPFYFTDVVVAEGTPVKRGTAQDKVVLPANGEGAKVIGLAAQATYDESAFGQLKNYKFFNDTREKLGRPIGVLTGVGYALTNNYAGAVTWGDKANLAIDGGSNITGKLTATATTNNALPVIFEGAGTSGDKLVRIAFNFPLA